MTNRQILSEAVAKLKSAEIEEAESDAWILFSEVMGMDRTSYLVGMNDEVSDDKAAEFNRYISMRLERIPVQYITGKTCFMGFDFKVTEDVLIPRFDTEILVDEALKQIKPGECVLDMCTGSGCIAVAVKLLTRDVLVSAADISPKALAVANDNAKNNNAVISFIQTNMFSSIQEKYDVILSNPPYIKTADIDELLDEVKNREPRLALEGGADGLVFYRILAKEGYMHLNDGGRIIMEIGYDQGKAVSNLLKENNFADIKVIQDLAGLDRVVCGRKG